MKRNWNNKNYISGITAFLVFALFAVSILVTLFLGVTSYQKLNERNQISFQERTCVQYFSTKVRQAQDGDRIQVTSFGEGDALVIGETIGGLELNTYLYCYEGWLREVYTAQLDGFDPEVGGEILPMENMDIRVEDGLLILNLDDGKGDLQEVYLALRSGEVANYEE